MSNLDQYSHRPLEARAQSGARDVPLAASLSVLFGSFLTQFGVVFFGAGMLFGAVVLMSMLGERTFGVGNSLDHTEATVTLCKPGRDGEKRIYDLVYEFRALGGERFAGRGVATTEYKPGDKLTIEYSARHPADNRIEGSYQLSQSYWFMAIFLLFPAIGLATAIAGLRTGRRHQRLLKVGLPARGMLVNKEATTTRINKQLVYRLTFDFTTPDGRHGSLVEKTHLTRDLEDETGELLLYDPEDLNVGAVVDAFSGDVRVDDSGRIVHFSSSHAFVFSLLPIAAAIIPFVAAGLVIFALFA